ncbi:MAG: DNA primase [Nitrospinota bacterium]
MSRIPEELIERIRQGAPIEEVVGEYVALKREGSRLKALCPFHQEKTPSFFVNPRLGIFKCFGCGAGGNVFHFLMRHEGMSFVEAAEHLAKRQGIELRVPRGRDSLAGERERALELNALAARFFRAQLLAPSAGGARAREYLRVRGVSEEASERFQLGYAPAGWDGLLRHLASRGCAGEEGARAGLLVARERGSGYYDRFRDRIMFPIHDAEGRAVGFGGRALPESDARGAGAKYLNSPETAAFRKGRVLYGLQQGREAIRAEGRALVTEGYFDVISLWSHGFRNAVAPLGTALTAEQLRLLRAGAEEVLFVFDQDLAGREAVRRGEDRARGQFSLAGAPDGLMASEVLKQEFLARGLSADVRLKVVVLPEGEDVDSFLRARGAEAFRSLVGRAQAMVDFTVEQSLAGVGPESDLADKVAALRRIAPILGAWRGTVRNEYERRLVERLRIHHGLIQQVLEEENKPLARPRREGVLDLISSPRAHPSAEMTAARILLVRPDLSGAVEGRAGDFTDPLLREVVEVVLRARREGRTPSAAALADALPSPAARELVATLAAEEVEEPERALGDCLARLREASLRGRSRALQARIIEARRKGVAAWSEPMRELLREKNALLRELSSLGEGARRGEGDL